jgi:hypothetical protein
LTDATASLLNGRDLLPSNDSFRRMKTPPKILIAPCLKVHVTRLSN